MIVGREEGSRVALAMIVGDAVGVFDGMSVGPIDLYFGCVGSVVGDSDIMDGREEGFSVGFLVGDDVMLVG